MKQDLITTIEQWIGKFAQSRTELELEKIRCAGKILGEAKVFVPANPAIGRAGIVADLKMDIDCILAALLCGYDGTGILADSTIENLFGSELLVLIQQTNKTLRTIHTSFKKMSDKQRPGQLEQLRRMLLASVADIRVILISLADRVQALRLAASIPADDQHALAVESMQVFAPLANRLGVGQLKWELEDWSFRYLQPESYRQIAKMLQERRQDRQHYLEQFMQRLKELLQTHQINAEVTGRVKHIYSIWRKMREKGQDFHRLFDIRAVRILVDTKIECYTVLGIVHTQWQAILSEFDDYIAVPKENKYQSLHTAVIGPQDKTVEIQIRTRAMHEHAEFGVAAHWVYKEGGGQGEEVDRRLMWLRGLLDSVSQSREEGLGSIDAIEEQLSEDRIYVLTPQGKILDFPNGATPIDFAFSIHTDVGYRCRGAKVEGRMVTLTYQLKNGERVEILTTKHSQPSRDWLNPNLAYIKTSRARAKIREWFKKQDHDVNVTSGRAALERELRRLNIKDTNYDQLAKHFDMDTEELFAKIGRADMTAHQAVNKLIQVQPEPIKLHRRHRKVAPSNIEIQGVGNLLTHLASCCKPIAHDSIIGYITKGRGVTVHRADCANILRLQGRYGDRLIEVEWSQGSQDSFVVDIVIEAYERHGLAKDITLLLSTDKINLIGIHMTTNEKDNTAQINLSIETSGVDQLSRVLARISQLPNVITVQRR